MEQILTTIKSDVIVRFFTLVVSYDEMILHVKGDPSREPIRSEVGYKKMQATFLSQIPFLREASECIEADDLTLDQITEYIAGRVLAPTAIADNGYVLDLVRGQVSGRFVQGRDCSRL